MAQEHAPPPGVGPMAEYLGKIMGLPSPEKVIVELQRLNTNIEKIQPDIHSLSESLKGIKADDLRNLSGALGGIKVGDIIRLLNEFNTLGNQVYKKLWPEK